jgi:hypothetical protein
MAVGQLGLVQNQDDGLAVGGSPLQSLTRKRFHDRVADHQRIAEQARNPLIAHVGTSSGSPAASSIRFALRTSSIVAAPTSRAFVASASVAEVPH